MNSVYPTFSLAAYGTLYSDVALAPRGPRFTILPESVVVADRVDSTYLECEADSLPPPSYTWSVFTAP